MGFSVHTCTSFRQLSQTVICFPSMSSFLFYKYVVEFDFASIVFWEATNYDKSYLGVSKTGWTNGKIFGV